jgi:hypothetical protein
VIVDDSQPSSQEGFASIQVFDGSSFFKQIVAKGTFGISSLVFTSKDIRWDESSCPGKFSSAKKFSISRRVRDCFAEFKQVFMPVVPSDPVSLSNLRSIACSCHSNVVPWIFNSESGRDLCVNSWQSLLGLFLSRLTASTFLIRAKRSPAVTADQVTDFSEDDFRRKIISTYAAGSADNL